MPEISTGGIIAIITSAALAVVGAVPLMNFIAGLVEARRKRKQEREKTHLSMSAEIAKIELERDEMERDELKELYEDCKSKCADCLERLEASENSSLLSRKTKREINAMMLKINKNLYSMRKGFEEKYHVLKLKAIFEHIDKQFSELEDLMP